MLNQYIVYYIILLSSIYWLPIASTNILDTIINESLYPNLDIEFEYWKNRQNSLESRIKELDAKILEIESNKIKKNKITQITKDDYIYEYEYIYLDEIDKKYQNDFYDSKPQLYLLMLDDKNEYLIMF